MYRISCCIPGIEAEFLGLFLLDGDALFPFVSVRVSVCLSFGWVITATDSALKAAQEGGG